MTLIARLAPIGLTAALAAGCSAAETSGPVPAPPDSASALAAATPAPAPVVDVPRIRPYVSLRRAKRRLDSVGLVGVRRDQTSPRYFYVLDTRPRSGTTVEVGSTVEILTGDG